MSLLVRGASGDEVTRAWQGKAVVCIASGPSLSKEQLDLIRRAREADAVRVIVVNDNYLVAPWADLLYFADRKWWEWHSEGIAKSWPWAKFTKNEVRDAFKGFAGQKATIKHGPAWGGPEIFALTNEGPDRLSEKPTGICTGSNSGYQVINIAVLSGGRPILLVGYDMHFQGKQSHAHNGHPVSMPEEAYKKYARNFASMNPQLKTLGIEVINCTSGSLIDAFPRGDLASLLPHS